MPASIVLTHCPYCALQRGMSLREPAPSQQARADGPGKPERAGQVDEGSRRAPLHLQLTPGTDLALANGLLHIAIADRCIDAAYIAARTTGFDEVRQAAAGYWPERVERITGVPVAQQRAAVRLLEPALPAAGAITGRRN